MPSDSVDTEASKRPKPRFFPVSLTAVIWVTRAITALGGMMVLSVPVLITSDFHIATGYHNLIICTIVACIATYLLYWINVFPCFGGHLHPFKLPEHFKRKAEKPFGLFFIYAVAFPIGLAFFMYAPLISLLPWLTLTFNENEVSRTFTVSTITTDAYSRVGCHDKMSLVAEGFMYKNICIDENVLATFNEGDTVLAFGPQNPMGMLIRRVEKISP